MPVEFLTDEQAAAVVDLALAIAERQRGERAGSSRGPSVWVSLFAPATSAPGRAEPGGLSLQAGSTTPLGEGKCGAGPGVGGGELAGLAEDDRHAGPPDL